MTSCEKCRICKEMNIVEHGEPDNDDPQIHGFRCYVCKGINDFYICRHKDAQENIVLGYDPAEA